MSQHIFANLSYSVRLTVKYYGWHPIRVLTDTSFTPGHLARKALVGTREATVVKLCECEA
jgi:hypothetical protein